MSWKKILENLPKSRMAFAYGSGVIPQKNQTDPSKNMLDLVIVTDNPEEWHKENLKRNWKHYSFLRYLGAKRLADIQSKFGAKVYYNTLVEIEDRCVKYGVISQENLIDDLLDWDHLYISGRLHKPVEFITPVSDNHPLAQAMITNKQSALHTALLLMPEEFSELELFTTLAGLSYLGDFRMHIGEDRRKVENIVAKNVQRFRSMYESTLLLFREHLHWNRTAGTLEQSCCPISVSYHLNLLPKKLIFGIVNRRNFDGRHRDTDEVLHNLAHDQTTYGEIITAELAKIVKASSWSQSIKGVFTAGISKSIQYSQRKVQKYLNSL